MAVEIETMPGFDLVSLEIDGKRIGCVAMRGHEIHLQIDRNQALRHARRIIKGYIAPRLVRLGHLTTISTGDPATERFLDRLGFYRIGGFGSITMHRLDALKIQ